MAVGAKRRNEAAMHGDVVEPYRAGAAVARVASLFDSEPSHLPQESSQALSRTWLFRERLAVDQITQECPLSASSRRISSAKCSVMCFRYSGVPWTSSKY